jgi:hypothetical protein
MAHEGFQQLLSYTAGADLSAHQYKLVKLSSGEIVAATAGAALGVLVDAPASGDPGSVVVLGITKVVAGTGGIAEGALVTSDASGEGVAAALGDEVIGRALYAADAGDLCTIVATHASVDA